MQWTIRRGVETDATSVVEYNRRLAEETEDKILDAELLRPGVMAVLRDPHKGLYFVAELNGQIIGQMMVTFEWSDWRNGWFWWIQSVYVHADFRQQGVFRSLYEHVERLANADPQVIGIRLYVDDHNSAAQQTYARLGLKRTTYYVLEKYPL